MMNNSDSNSTPQENSSEHTQKSCKESRQIITAILINPHNPDYRNIYADDKFLCALPWSVILTADLHIGYEIPPDFFEKTSIIKDIKRAKQRALIILSYRMHSKDELYDKLLAKDFPPEASRGAITELEAEGLIDDYQFAKVFAQSLIRRSFGISQVKYKLRGKSIADDIINEICYDISEKNDFCDIIYKTIEKKYSSLNLSEKKNRDKVLRFFAAKGYDIGDIVEAVNQYTADNP